MEDKLVWKGYEWMNGQPWGVAHPNKEHTWYCDKAETNVLADGSLIMGINNNSKYFEEIGYSKPFGCGCISTFEPFLYGKFHFEYKLPKGIHLWPAIWLSGVHSWPPEIDIMEGWSGNGYFCKNKPNYRRFPLFNNIHPGIFYTKHGEEVYSKSYGSFGSNRATYSWLQKLDEWNTCDLIWKKDLIEVYYNDRRVMKITDNDEDRGYYMLDFMNKEMYVCIDSWTGDNFTQEDYKHYKENGTKFIIKEFTYEKITD